MADMKSLPLESELEGAGVRGAGGWGGRQGGGVGRRKGQSTEEKTAEKPFPTCTHPPAQPAEPFRTLHTLFTPFSHPYTCPTPGYNNILEWSLDKERLEGNDQGQRAAAAGDDSAPAPAASPTIESSSAAAAAAAASGASAAGPDAAAGATGELPSPTRRAPGLGGASGQSELFRTRDSAGYAAPKSRPLYAKLELLLDLVFRRLFWDPSQADVPFNYDALLKLIKKVDKDMGP